MKKFLLTLLLCLTLGAASAWAEEQVEFAFTIATGDIDGKTNPNIASYDKDWDFTKNGYKWTLYKFNNNNGNSWTYVRAYKKNQTTPATASIATKTPATKAICTITINMQRTQSSELKGLSLEIADNENYTNSTTFEQTIPTEEWASGSAFDYVIKIADPQPERFYKINFTGTNTNTSKQGALQLNSVTYSYDDTPAGPVEPGEVLVNGEAASTEPIEAVDGETITFTSDKAAKLEYLSEELNLLDEVTGSTYPHKADFSKGNTYQITVTPYDSDNKEYSDKAVTVTISKKLVTPEAVLVNGSSTIQDFYDLAQGEEITFTSTNATKLKFDIDALGISEQIPGSTYTHKADFSKGVTEYTLSVFPYDNYGEPYHALAATVTIKKKAAPLCGEITFTPADGAVYAGNAVTIACENATEIKYTIDGGEELTYDAATGIEITAACTIVAWGINGDGVEGEKATLNVTIKEADKYVLINRVSDIKPGAKYILYGYNNSKKTGSLMGAINGSYCNAITYGERTNIIIVGETDYAGLNVFTLDEGTTTGSYTIQLADNKYLGTTNYSATSNGNLTTGTSNTGTGYNWVISFNNEEAVIKCGTQQLYYNASSPRFKTYTSTQAAVYLYRLIDDEYYKDEAPAELHIHGSHYAGSWAESSQFDQTATGVFTFYGFLAYEEGEATPALVFSTAAKKKADDPNTEVTGIRPRKAAPAADYWNDIDGDVFMPETNGATVGTHKLVRVSTAELAAAPEKLNTFAAEHNKSYDLTVDFNGYSPVATLAEHDDSNVPTGVENIDAAETAEVEYFNLSGLRVANPENGIFIRRQGNKVTKVLVK